MDEKTNWTSLRNQAAIAAMQGLLSNASLVDPAWDFRVSVEKAAVGYADALIAELRKKSEGLDLATWCIPVGESFEYEGELFVCVENKDGLRCGGCAFYGKSCGYTPLCNYATRKDKKNVVFKKIED